MERTGYQGASRAAAGPLPSLHRDPVLNVVCLVRPQPSTSVSSLRVLLIRQPQIPDLARSRLNSRKRQFLPRCSLEEVSVAENVSQKENVRNLNDRDRTSQQCGDSKFLSQAISQGLDNGAFNWLAQWYPLGVLKHMDKRQPNAVTILGRDLVVWWDRSGAQWQVFADVCPHRLAPLSEGRINEQGHLQCSYHGWVFAPNSGACSLIPQATKDQIRVKDSGKACAKVYLSQQHQGMLWVFMYRGEDAEERATANPPPFVPGLSDPDFVYDMGMSDVSHSYESLIENLLDPAHVPFAHHKLQGNRKFARPLNFQVEELGKNGFEGIRDGFFSQRYIAPCLTVAHIDLPPSNPRVLDSTYVTINGLALEFDSGNRSWFQGDFHPQVERQPQGHPLALKLREFIMSKRSKNGSLKRQILTIFFCVPVAPGKSKVFYAFPRNFAKFVYHFTPRWWSHLLHMTVLDSDMYLLHVMERRIEDRGGMANIERLCYTPTAADAFVIAYRKWLKKFAGGVPDFGPRASDRLPPMELRRRVLDRYSLHVAHCTTCSGALRNLKAIELVLQVLPCILLGLVAASSVKSVRGLGSFTMPLICIAAVCSVASRWLSYWIEKNYEFHDYNHALIE